MEASKAEFLSICAGIAEFRAGSAHVPLDVECIGLRLRFAVEDSGSKVLAGRTALVERLGLRILAGVDPTRNRSAMALVSPAEDAPSGAASIDSGSLESQIYTLQSIGLSKSVEITHGGLCRLVRRRHDDRGSAR